MSYSTPAVYQEALQFPRTAFTDPELQEAQPDLNLLGLPRAITGACAVVFPVTTRSGHRYAVRCFTVPPHDRVARYRAIQRYLPEHPLPFLVEFDYQRRGIRIGERLYPVLKMEWIEGQTLNQFVEQHLHQSEILSVVNEQFYQMVQTLEAAGIAHGDLQHGNILVQKEEGCYRLRLVDYDAMYVPALQGKKPLETGHRNYQHPDRPSDRMGPTMDRFSALVIYTALKALQVRPDLWETFNTGENLLFQAADFYHPEDSPLFQTLYELETLQPLVYALQRACFQEPEEVPSLRDLLEGRVSRSVHSVRRFRRRTRHHGTGVLRFPLAVPALLLPVVGGLLGGLGLAGGLLALESIALLTGVTYGYSRLPIVQRRQRLKQEMSHVTSVLTRLRAEQQTLIKEKERFLSRQDAFRVEQLQKLQDRILKDRLKHHFIQEIEHVEGLSHKTVIRLKSAGIRNAYQATETALARVRYLPDEQRARILLWRNALIAHYRKDIPQALSPAEERQIQRLIVCRVEEMEAEIARLKERITVQEQELQALRAQLGRLPEMSPLDYAFSLIGFKTLPSLEQPPAPPPPRSLQAGPPPAEEKAWWELM